MFPGLRKIPEWIAFGIAKALVEWLSERFSKPNTIENVETKKETLASWHKYLIDWKRMRDDKNSSDR